MEGEGRLGELETMAAEEDPYVLLHPVEVEAEEAQGEGEVEADGLPPGRDERSEGRCVAMVPVPPGARERRDGQRPVPFEGTDACRVRRGEAGGLPARERGRSEGVTG